MNLSGPPDDYLTWAQSQLYDHVLIWDEFGSRYEDQNRVFGDPDSNTAEQNLAKWNSLDRSIDPQWLNEFWVVNAYQAQGAFRPGNATMETLLATEAQWKRDSAPNVFDKLMKVATSATLAFIAGSAAYGLYAGAATTAEVAGVVDAAPPMTQAEVDALVASAAPYAGEGYSMAQLVAPETLSAAASVATGTATTAQVATVAKSGLSAMEILGTAKSMIGAAGTIATIAKMTTGAIKINPATGTPYNLPPGYQPTVTPGAGEQDVNYGGILKQLAIPVVGLLAVFLLKG